MPARLGRRVTVATCIACGMRHRPGDGEHDCADLPLDLVEAGDVDALEARVTSLAARATALRAVATEVAAGAPDPAAVARRARVALRLPAGPPVPEAQIVEAWGCPECGRVDAPQPCLGVCVHVPVLMADAAELDDAAERVARAEAADAALTPVARLVAQVRPRPGHESETMDALAVRARGVLERLDAG